MTIQVHPTTVSVNDQEDGPPSLNYDLRARLVSNIMFWSTNVMTVTVIPIIVFYSLTYCTSLDIKIILSITSAISGVPAILQLPFRFWKVWKQDGGDRRPLSGYIVDLFMCEYIIIFIILTVLYTVSSSIPILPLYLMIPSTMVGFISLQFLLSFLLPPLPIWISSTPPGQKLRPSAYYIMEDVVAVDGGGRSAFRKALNTRYEQSPIFQKLLFEMTIYWAIVGIIFVGFNAAITFTISFNIAFGVTLGWTTVWPFFCFIIAQRWVRHRLAQEEQWFKMKVHTSSQAIDIS